MAEKFAQWDSAEYLKTEEDMSEYLNACIEETGDDPAFIAKALGTIARACGMSQVARNAGIFVLFQVAAAPFLKWLKHLGLNFAPSS